jgi:hypothetical protein
LADSILNIVSAHVDPLTKAQFFGEGEDMDPWQVGRCLRRFCQWSINILSVLMIIGGLHLTFSGEDQDDKLIGAINIIFGTTLFSLVED